MLREAIILSLFLSAGFVIPAKAEDCALKDRACVITSLRTTADQIETPAWRDQTYRELAKTLAFEGDIDGAIALIPKIENQDTKAMTIRGIGMAAADTKHSKEDYVVIFQKLREAANKITDAPSYAIALTYIAMSQAFAGDNDGAWRTASEMSNEALRHKAYGETAEIQAEEGDAAAAMKSIGFITSSAYQNKAYATVSKILADKDHLEDALKAAQAVTNPYKKAEALQYLLDKQKPREVPHSKTEEIGTEP